MEDNVLHVHQELVLVLEELIPMD